METDEQMSLTVKNKKLHKNLIGGKKPKTDEDYAIELFEHLMSLSTRIVRNESV